jgi:hypothetical protein
MRQAWVNYSSCCSAPDHTIIRLELIGELPVYPATDISTVGLMYFYGDADAPLLEAGCRIEPFRFSLTSQSSAFLP